MITFDWYGIHDVAATSGLLLVLVQKKYQKLILSDRYRFITRQDEGGWDWKSVENMSER